MVDNELAIKDKRYKESFFKRLLNRLLVGFLILISVLPFSFIYFLSDIISFLLRYVIRYRRKVVLENLKHAFPEKDDRKLQNITNRFYKHFTDVMLEVAKMYSINEQQMRKRVKFKGLDQFEKLYQQNKSFIILSMHHNNWEWTSVLPLYVKHKAITLYNPIRGNRTLDNFILHSREKWGGKCIPVHKSSRTVMKFNRSGQPTLLGLVADQTPPATSDFWTIFLNREAPFFSGPEKIAKRTNQPVYFHRIRKIDRGKYEMIFTPICENPMETEPNEILLHYVRKIEEIISEEPEHYLWSHRRWKHKRPVDIPLTT